MVNRLRLQGFDFPVASLPIDLLLHRLFVLFLFLRLHLDLWFHQQQVNLFRHQAVNHSLLDHLVLEAHCRHQELEALGTLPLLCHRLCRLACR